MFTQYLLQNNTYSLRTQLTLNRGSRVMIGHTNRQTEIITLNVLLENRGLPLFFVADLLV